MSIINTFLQKRKLQESHYGIVMVITAYALSFVMLVLGSDTFYNIRSGAEGISKDTDEAAQVQINEEILSPRMLNLKTQELQSKFVDPYGVEEDLNDGNSEGISPVTGDTNWLLGYAMDTGEYNNVMEQMDKFNSQGDSSQSQDITEVTTENTTKDTTKDTIEEFSVEETNTSVMSVTNKEVDMLERIVEAEASGEDTIGKILIVNVILNRIADDEFPDSIKEVIFQTVAGDYQFSPISDERYWSVEVTENTEEAVQRALEGEDYSEGALYFMSRKNARKSNIKWFDQNLERLFKHGGHEFFK